MPERLPTRDEALEGISQSFAGYAALFIRSSFGALGIGLLVDFALGAWGVPAGFAQCWLAAWAGYFPVLLVLEAK